MTIANRTRVLASLPALVLATGSLMLHAQSPAAAGAQSSAAKAITLED